MVHEDASRVLVNLKDVGVGLTIMADKIKGEGEIATELRNVMLNILKDMNSFFKKD